MKPLGQKDNRWYKNKWVRVSFLLVLFVLYAVLMSVFVGSACPLSLATGFPCPACGMSRANILFFTGLIHEAFQMHPLFLFSFVFAGIVFLAVWKPEFTKKRIFTLFCIVSIIAFIVTYAVRMILYYPDTVPMVYNWDSLLGLILKAFGWGG